MICFNCNFRLIQHTPYRYNHEHIGFIEFFKNLFVGVCPNCQIIQIDHAELDENKLHHYYSKIYREKAKLGVDSGSEYDKNYFIARAKAQIKLIKRYCKTDVKNIFEFGSGYGYGLIEAGKYFPKAKLFTNEIDKTIQPLGNFNQFQPNLKHDIVIMSHVLEHLRYPQKTIQDIISNLAIHGILFIEVPSETKNIFSTHESLEPHITFFSLSSLKNFINFNFTNQLEIIYAGTAGLVSLTESSQYTFFTKIRNSLFYRLMRFLRWILNGFQHKPFFVFDNDTEKDVWNNIRVICRKKIIPISDK